MSKKITITSEVESIDIKTSDIKVANKDLITTYSKGSTTGGNLEPATLTENVVIDIEEALGTANQKQFTLKAYSLDEPPHDYLYELKFPDWSNVLYCADSTRVSFVNRGCQFTLSGTTSKTKSIKIACPKSGLKYGKLLFTVLRVAPNIFAINIIVDDGNITYEEVGS